MNYKQEQLQYCLTHWNNFPHDIRTARNFINLKFAETALELAETEEERIKIDICKKGAMTIIAMHDLNKEINNAL